MAILILFLGAAGSDRLVKEAWPERASLRQGGRGGIDHPLLYPTRRSTREGGAAPRPFQDAPAGSRRKKDTCHHGATPSAL